MGLVRWILLGVMTLFAVIMVLGYFDLAPWSTGSSESVQYHCPMHPTFITNQPGDCPICGMSLVPITGADSTSQPTPPAQASTTMHHARPGQYICPMDPDVIADVPGRCPKCGMFLEKVAGQPEPDTTWMCPMHPEVTSNQPGTCPKCGGMELVPVETPAETQPEASVAGLIPVTIAPERLQLIGVRTGSVARRTLGGTLRLLGFVVPDEKRVTSVNIRFSGWIRTLAVNQTGLEVSEGQKLFSVYSQEVFQAEQEYLLAKQSIQATEDVQVREVRRRLFDASRQRLELLGVSAEERLQLETEGLPRSESWIRCPTTGVVLEKNIVSGQYVSPDQSLFVVADLSRVWVIADVYERDLAHVKTGQTVHMRTSAYPGESFEGRVEFIYPALSEETRTLKVRIEFANSDRRLKPGQYAEIDLEGSGPSVLSVPAEAVMDEGKRQYAFVVHEGVHFEPRPLQLGKRSDDYVEVLSGLSEGDVVVTSANFLIDAESRLKAAMAGKASAPAPTSHGEGH